MWLCPRQQPLQSYYGQCLSSPVAEVLFHNKTPSSVDDSLPRNQVLLASCALLPPPPSINRAPSRLESRDWIVVFDTH